MFLEDLHVCIIDDDDSVRIATGSLLRSLGWESHLYSSAEAFLASGMVEQTHCIISDVHMPGMNGIQLQRELAVRRHDVPFIFISAFSTTDIVEQAMASGALCFLSKPVDIAVIVRYLDDLKSGQPRAQNGPSPDQ